MRRVLWVACALVGPAAAGAGQMAMPGHEGGHASPAIPLAMGLNQPSAQGRHHAWGSHTSAVGISRQT